MNNQCPNCGKVLNLNQKFCTGCGVDLVSGIRCLACGKLSTKSNQKFCNFCGSELPLTEEKKSELLTSSLNFVKKASYQGPKSKAQLEEEKSKEKLAKEKRKILHTKYPVVEIELGKNNLSEVKKILEEMTEEAKKWEISDVLDWIKEKMAFTSDKKREELTQQYSIINSLVSEKNYPEALKECEIIKQKAKTWFLYDVVDWCQEKTESILERKKQELQQNYPGIEKLISHKNYSDAIKECEYIILDAKKYSISEVVDWAQKKIYLCLTIQLQQNYPTIEALISQKKYTEAANECDKLIQEASKLDINEVVDWAQKKKTFSSMLDKLIALFSISEKVNINDVSSILEIDRTSLFKKLVDWAKMFDFKIDGDYLKIKTEDVDKMIGLLDQSFSEWTSVPNMQQKKT